MSPTSTRFTLMQFLNVPGLKALKLIYTNPTYIVPDIHITSVANLDLDYLKSRGIECLVFDKDNTLSYCYSDVIHASAIPIVRRAEEMFPGGIAILSNSAGSSDDEGWKMADKTEENIGLPVIRHMVKKPGCLNEVLSHFEGRMNKNITPKQICVIGDRVMTDVVFANQYDMISVLVDPLSSVRDHPAAIVFRFLELQLLLPIIKWYLNTCCKSSKK